MKLKSDNRTPPGGRVFYYEGPGEGDKKKTYQVGPANSMPQLVEWSRRQMEAQGMLVPEHLQEIIEHQMCVRMEDSRQWCWSSGIGDDIHTKWAKPFLSRIQAVAEKGGILGKTIAKVVGKIKSCSSCGGTRVYKSGANNAGRAGTLNKLSK